MDQKSEQKWTGEVVLQPTFLKSDSLLGAINGARLGIAGRNAPNPTASRRPTEMLSPNHRPLNWPIARLLFVFGILAIYRVLVELGSPLALHYDEAQYFGWSLAPAWGYFSKPPMVAWSIWVARHTCGEAEWCVRLPALLALLGAALALAATARHLLGSRAAYYTGLVLVTAPLVSFYSGVITTDSLLILFWSLGLYALIKACDGGGLGYWLLCGLACGLGLLTKYTMGVFAISALLWMWFDSQAKRHLRTAGPWIGALLAFALFAGNLRWQMTHQFATVAHTVEISSASSPGANPLARLTEFVLAQPLLQGFLFAIVAALGLILHPRPGFARTDPFRAIRLGWTFCWPMLAIISLQALLSRAHANWAAPAIVGASLMAGASLINLQRGTFWFKAGIGVNIVFLAIVVHGPWWVEQLRHSLPQLRNPYDQLLGWRELGTQVKQWLAQHPEVRVASNERRILSELIYYARPNAFPVYAWNPEKRVSDHYRLLYDLADQTPGRYLMVLEAGTYDEALLRASFTEVQAVMVVEQPLSLGESVRYELLLVSNLPAPIPPPLPAAPAAEPAAQAPAAEPNSSASAPAVAPAQPSATEVTPSR